MITRLFGAYLKLCFLFILCTGQLSGLGQKKGNIILGGSYQQGTILVHSNKIKHFASVYPSGVEFTVQEQTTGKVSWQANYNYPRLGLSFLYFDYHNPVIGKSFATSAYLNLPLIRLPNQELFFRFGSGLAYFTNKFDPKNNPTDNIISTNYNAVIQTRFEYTLALYKNLGLMAGIGLNHYSNGGNSKPNLGVNIATGTVGLSFNNFRTYEQVKPENNPLGKKNYFAFSTSLGIKQRNDFDTTRYIVNSVSLQAFRKLTSKNTVLIALEGFYDPSLIPRRALDPRIAPGATPDIRRFSFNAGHELHVGKIAFGSQVGYYFYRPYKADAAFFQRLETKYQFHKNFFIAADLKLHDIIKADIIEYRLGIRI